jgi:hypothetical protein
MDTPETFGAFVDLLAARYRETPGVEVVEVEPNGELRLTFAGGTEGRVNPHNAWRAVKTGEPLERVLQTQAATIAAAAQSGGKTAPWDEIAPRLVTRLERPALAQQGERVARSWAVTPVLWEIVVEDSPTHMRGILLKDADAWGKTPAAVFDHGLQQLRRLAERGPRPRQHGPKIWVMTTGDGYAASRLLVPDWLLSALPSRRAPRGWMCATPARDALVLTPLGDPRDLDQARAFAATVRSFGQMAHPFPVTPLILADGAVHSFDDLAQVA